VSGSPVVICGSGGSGTRIVARAVRHAGYFMGLNLNASDDSLDVAAFLNRWVDAYLEHEPWIAPGPEGPGRSSAGWDGAPQMAEDFVRTIDLHRSGALEEPHWGWKAPRTIFLLPFVHRQFPRMRLVHVVRDGKDMAYSKNQAQLVRHGAWVLSDEERERLAAPVRAMTFWSRVNLAAARYGEARLGERYLRVRFEDACADPATTIRRIFEHVGRADAPSASYAAAVAEVAAPPTIGRWRGRNSEEVAALAEAGGAGLAKFGYADGMR
jgi:hypothetical protein